MRTMHNINKNESPERAWRCRLIGTLAATASPNTSIAAQIQKDI